MRIAFCSHFPSSAILDESARPEHPLPWVHLLARSLVDGGHVRSLDVLTHSSRYTTDRVVERDGVTFHLFAWRDHLDLAPVRLRGYQVAWGRGLWRLTRRLRRLAPDVVHAHGTDDIYGLAASLSGAPSLVSLQGMMAAIGQVHPTPRRRWLRRMEALTLRRARAINAKTPGGAAFARKLNARAEIFQVEDPVAEEYFAAPVPPAGPTLHFVGELVPRKGVEQWIEAFAHLARGFPRLRGRIVGAGPASYRLYLDKLLQEGQLEDRVTLTGPLDPAVIAASYAAEGGIFCLPSLAEHCPNVIMEAMAAGLPVVASRVGDIPHLVADEESGLLVGAPDSLLVAEALARLLDDPAWHQELGLRGRQIALDRWSPGRCAREHARLYAGLAGGAVTP